MWRNEAFAVSLCLEKFHQTSLHDHFYPPKNANEMPLVPEKACHIVFRTTSIFVCDHEAYGFHLMLKGQAFWWHLLSV